jgi:aminopeptidase YwaD
MAKVRMTKLQAGKMAKEALRLTKELVDKYGPRLVGSEACMNTANDLQDEFAKHCDSTQADRFTLHPGAFLGWIRLMVVLYPFALAFLWFKLPLFAFLLGLAGVVVMVFEFLLYRELIDPFFPSVTGVNVHGVIEPEKEVRQTVIFSGHHDSARVFNFYDKNPHLYIFKVLGALGSFLVLFLLAFVWTLMALGSGTLFDAGGPSGVLLIILAILTAMLPVVANLWFFASDKGTPGAGDNLIACAMAVELSRYFSRNKDNGIPLVHTRLIFASFDGEEAGLRGARAFYAKYKNQLLTASTWNFNVDCPYFAKDLFFLTSDINGSVKLSQEMATQCVTIARSMGFEAKSQPIAFLTGGTDAAEAARVGIRAVSLMAMPWDTKEVSAVYHTPRDLPESIEPQVVEETLSIAIRFIEQADAASV